MANLSTQVFTSIKELRDSFIVWRGINEAETYAWDGMSWTANRDLALWHAYQKCEDGENIALLCARVKKESVIASDDSNTNFIINPTIEKIRVKEYLWSDFEDADNKDGMKIHESYIAWEEKLLGSVTP